MSAAAVVSSLFTGPSPTIVAVIFVLAIAAAATVLLMFRGLLVDPRSDDASAEFAGTAGVPDEIADAGAFES
jgi:hypothetical protein